MADNIIFTLIALFIAVAVMIGISTQILVISKVFPEMLKICEDAINQSKRG